MNQKNVHWWLVDIDIAARQLNCYDSCGFTYASQGFKDSFMDNVLLWMHTACIGHQRNSPIAQALLGLDVRHWPAVLHDCNYAQVDYHSCGVYTAQAALHVALGLNPKEMAMTDSDAVALREKMALSIVGKEIIF